MTVYDWRAARDAEKQRATGVPAGNGAIPVATEGATRYALAALEAECAELAAMAPDTGRNPKLNQAAYRMARHIGAGSIDHHTVRDALQRAAQACRLPQHEINTVLRDNDNGALLQGQTNPRYPAERTPTWDTTGRTQPWDPTGTSPSTAPLATANSAPTRGTTTPDAAASATEATAEQVSDAIRARVPALDWHALWADDDEEEWVVEPLLPARRLVALFSAPKVGKSLLMLEIAVAVSRGTEVLGTPIDRPRRVLYVDFENDPRGDIRQRLQSMGLTPDQLDDLCYLSFPRLSKLDTIIGGAELMAIIAEYRCEVVVIDTISRAVQGEENENDTWLSFYRNTGILLKSAGITCIRLDHTGKDHDKGMRGGSAKYGDVDAVWKLAQVTDETYRLDCTDHRMPINEKCLVVKRLPLPHLHHQVQAEGRAAAFDAQVQDAITALDQLKLPNDTGRPAARDALKATGIRKNDQALTVAIRHRKARLSVFDGGI